GFEALSKAAETSAPQGFWRAVEDAAKALAGAEAAGAYHGRVVPALAQAMPGRLDALAEAISETARAAVNMTEETVKNGLAPLAALLAARPSELPKAAALLAAAALSAPEASRRENAFGIYWRAQQALARNPADLDSFLYISALFGRNGMDPATPQIFMRKVSSGWSIPQSWKVFPRLAYADGAPVGLSAEDAAQARDVAAFVRWVSEVTDNRFAFPVRATPAGQAALAAELGALAVATEVGRDAGGLLLTINPANRTAKDILAELKSARPADEPAAAEAAPASWPAVSAQEKREAALALDAALDYLRREHVSEEQKIHRYQSYSPIAPLILAELFPKRASEYQAQVERELRALTPGRDIEWEAWRSSLRRLGDSLLASGARNKAKSIYAEAFQFDNGLDITLALAKGGEHAEALRYLDLMGGIIAAGLPFSANAGKVRADVTRIREFVDALPQGGPWTALYLERVDRLYRRLLNSALDEVDQGLERSVGEWSEPRLGIPSVESSGLTAFLEYIHLSPHRNRSQDWAVRASKDAVPGGSTHGGRLEAVWKLLSDVLAGRAGVSAWATAAVERLWSSPVKAALLGKLAEKASGAEREGLLERQRAAEEGYDAASPLRALERAGVPMPGEERTVWETEIFPEQNFATGLRLSGDDPRIGRLETMAKALAGGQRAEAAAGVALARELAQDLEDGEPDDGLHLLRFGALRAFIDALIAAGYFGEAESLFSGLSGRLLSRGRALIDLGERREAAGDRDAFHMESTGRRLIKMSSALDVLSRAKIARRLLESGDAAAANAAADAIAREYGRRPQDYNLAHVIQAAKWMGEAPGLERAASGLLLAAIRREGAQTAHYADALT
ncbi:MAG TPA: hypothetical protein VNI01_10580, partial [Elusimicrobiota bacterium]|nr:hypothetical protein [Elusimicrobiota bacterium]